MDRAHLIIVVMLVWCFESLFRLVNYRHFEVSLLESLKHADRDIIRNDNDLAVHSEWLRGTL